MAVCMQTELRRWLQEFHLTANKSYTGSLEYLKTFSNVALSSVIYNRGIFPKKSYSVEKFNGQIIPMLKEKSDCHEANIFHSWISGFQDAIDKKYLHTVVLSFFDSKQPDVPIEETKFSFKYKSDNVTFESSEETSTIREDTLNFLKTSSTVLKNFGEFPKNYQMSMKLIYYDEVTPPDYEPPGYCAGGRDEEPEELSSCERHLIGSVATPCHKIRMVASKVAPPPPSWSVAESGNNSEAESRESTPDKTEKEMFLQETTDTSPTGDDDIQENTTKHRKVVRRSIHEAGDVELQCPCGKIFLEDTIQCQSCKKFQHSICFGLLAPVDPLEHYCDKCATENPRLVCTDPEFITGHPEYKKETCLFRNALAFCNKYRSISLDAFMENLLVSRKTAVHIIHELEKCNLFYLTSINPEDITHPRLVNHTMLQTKILPRYFSNLHQSQGQGAYLDPKSLEDHKNIAQELEDTPNILSQKDMEDYNPQLDASFCEDISNLQITMTPRTTRLSSRVKRQAERFIPEKEFPKKRKNSAGKVDSSKKLQRLCNV